MRHSIKRLGWSLAIAVALLAAATSVAAAAGPALQVTTLKPDYAAPGAGMKLAVSVLNTGDAPLNGTLTVTYTFPAGVSVSDPSQDRGPAPSCSSAGQVDQCTVDETGLPPGAQLRFETVTSVDPSATGLLVGSIEVSGAGAPQDVTVPWTIDTGPVGPFAFNAFDVGLIDGAMPATRAGADPAEVSTNVEFPSVAKTNLGLPFPNFEVTAPVEDFKDVVVHVPVGLVGNPTATPDRCDASQLTTPVPNTIIPQCPPESQIGVAQIAGGDIVPLYNVTPPVGSPAEFGFFYQSIVVTLQAKLRPSDDGIDIVTRDTPTSIPIPKLKVSLWGVPGDPSHDPLRGVCLNGGLGNNGNNCPLSTPTRQAFLRMPTSCTGNPLTWGADVNTYQHPDSLVSDSTTTPAMDGCPLVPFGPGLTVVPSTLVAHSPAGLDATLTMPQDNGPDGVAQADLKNTTVTLPAGMALNPSSADGLQACTDAQLNLGHEGVATCPNASKIGTVSISTPLLDHPVGGSIFLRTQNSHDPLSGQMFRIVIEIRSDDDGVDIKLPGEIKADPVTGQLTTTFDNNPQLPFSSLHLHFKDGPRAPLTNPGTCGAKTTSAQMTGWNASTVQADSAFTVSGDGQGGACPAPRFAPSVRAGVVNPVAGSSSAFVLAVKRDDTDNELKTITQTLPRGLLAKIAGVPQCTGVQADNGDCPAASQIGRVQVGAGSGPDPFYITTGKAYLTEGYRGAPFGLQISVPAVAGPFDLGTANVRAALAIDPVTTQVTVTSDPMPRILDGVPLDVRDVRVIIDRPGFMRAPTSCAPTAITTTLGSYTADTATSLTRFAIGDCANLAYAPKLALRLTGKGQTRDGRHPGVDAVLTQKPREAANRRVSVALPLSLALDPGNANALCEYADGLKDNCPASSVVGSATARTPLLDRPLTGKVYFVKGVRKTKTGQLVRTLPTLLIELRGEIALDLRATSAVDKTNKLVTTFPGIPDAPVTRFHLKINGGRHGILVVTGGRNICRGAQTAGVRSDAQNGKTHDFTTTMKPTNCSRRHH